MIAKKNVENILDALTKKRDFTVVFQPVGGHTDSVQKKEIQLENKMVLLQGNVGSGLKLEGK
jgi:hypothetical protein